MENIDVELLISLVRLKPYLFNKGDKRYKDLVLKENAWKEIADTLNSTVPQIVKLWKSLKDRFGRERKKIKIIPSGSAAGERTNWAWYDDLSFLNEFITERRRSSNMNKCSGLETKLSTQDMLNSQASVSSMDGGSDVESHSNGILLVESQPQYNMQAADEIPFATIPSSVPTQPVRGIMKKSKNISQARERADIPADLLPDEVIRPSTSTKRLVETPSTKRLENTPKNLLKMSNAVDTCILDTLQTLNNRKVCEESAFGELVATELSRIKNTSKRRELKRKIVELIYSEDNY
ncbi:transcription factor Adf-1-like [Photinus pyralis]|uniref:transcription factor Adf-1-like n=1 Tax=Photinus pyralis TaxID=7054 RepID=UPI0012671C84|nr:transcription factor Adf-1-like [Photinus pyralis]